MGPLREFAKRSSHYLIGRVFLILLGFVSFPLFTRVLTVDQYGVMSLVGNVILIGMTFAKVGMQNAVQRFHRENADSGAMGALPRYYSTVFFGTALTALCTAFVLIISLRFIPDRVVGPSMKAVLLIASVLIVTRAVQSIFMNLLQADGKTVLANAIEISGKAVGIAGVCLVLFYWERSVRGFYVGAVAVDLAIAAVCLRYVLKRKMLSFGSVDLKFFWVAAAFGFPLMWAELGAVVLDVGDRILVQYFLGAKPLGYYAAAYGIAQYAWELMVIPLSLALFPTCMDTWVRRGRRDTEQLLSQSLAYFSILAFALVCGVMLSSRDLIVILASNKYQAAHALLPFLVLGMVAAALQVFFRVGLLIHREPGVIFRITLLAIAVNMILNTILLPRIGLQGAALATLIAYALQAILTARSSLRVLPFRIDYLRLLKFMGCAAIAIIAGRQFSVENPWLELLTRMPFLLLYPVLLYVVDADLRKLARRIRGSASAQLARAVTQRS